ncbi:hypothetical protein IFM47457_04141 [Aspergillus lentulus]|nr:hypothetical protein IFM47457_04141 [Aspergillus lentulus]
MIKPIGQSLPTVVIETGWSESRKRLRDDMNPWPVGVGAYRLAAMLAGLITQASKAQLTRQTALVSLRPHDMELRKSIFLLS